MFSKDADEVADLFQEILINMWKGFSSFRGDSSVSTWIWRISLNTCINTSKKSRRLETIPLNVSINPYEDIDEETLQVRQLYDRINQLGLVDRSIILLWLENMTYEEIGAIMGISVKNVQLTDDPLRWALAVVLWLVLIVTVVCVEVKSFRLLDSIAKDLE